MTIGNPPFCLALYLSGARFQGELQPLVTWVGKKIRTRKIGGVTLKEELYASINSNSNFMYVISKITQL